MTKIFSTSFLHDETTKRIVGYIDGDGKEKYGALIPSSDAGAASNISAGRGNNFSGPVVVQIGDSFAANGVSVSASVKKYVNAGAGTWARILTGQRIHFPPENQLGVGGFTLATIISSQLTPALALKPDYVIINGGTNDLGSFTAAQMKDNITTIVNACLNNDAIPIIFPITPRNDSFSLGNHQKMEVYNRFVMDLCNGRPDLVTARGLPAHRRPYCIDIGPFYDYTSTTGGFAAGTIEAAGLHPSQGGGLIWGAQVADIINMTTPPSPTYVSSPYDFYDATNNPTGNLLNISNVNEGMLRGTNGSMTTNAGVTPTGQVCGIAANAYNALRVSGSSTATMVLSKEDPRQDGLITGARQRITINSTTTGGATETYRLQFTNGINGINSGYAAGDVLVFECAVQILSAVNFGGIEANLPATGGTNLSYTDGGAASNGVEGVHSSNFPQLLRPMLLRTPPMTVESGVTRFLPTLLITLRAGTTAPSIDMLTSDWRVYKLQ